MTKSPANPLTRLAASVRRRVFGDRDGTPSDARTTKTLKTQNALLADLLHRLDGVEAELRTVKTLSEKSFARLRHVEPGVEALLRARFLDPEQLPYPQRLTAHRFRLMSQNQEDGVTLGLLARAGTPTRRFVELGSGLSGGNSAVLAAEFGWTGLMVDGDAAHIAQVARRFPSVTAVSTWITAEGVNALIADHGMAGEIDLLSIDLDGNDYWVWQAIDVCSPRLVIVEYNSIYGPDRAVTIPYDPAFNRKNHRFIYYGASLAALARLATRKGYRLVAVDPSGINAYFLRNDVAPEVPKSEPRQAFRLLEKYDILIQQKRVDIFRYAEETGLPLVEID